MLEYIRNDSNWNPQPAKKPGVAIWRPLYLLDRFFATCGSVVFVACFGPQVPVAGALLYMLQRFGVVSVSADYVSITSVVCAQLVLAYLRRSYFYDAYATYYFIGTIIVAGLELVAMCAWLFWGVESLVAPASAAVVLAQLGWLWMH